MEPAARIDLWDARALVVARLGRVGLHAHAASALLVALEGKFRLRTPNGSWRTARQLHVPAHVRHELDCGETWMMVALLSPGTADVRRWASLIDVPVSSVSVFDDGGQARAHGRAHRNGQLDAQDLSAAFDTMVGGPSPARLSEDSRVDALARAILAAPEAPLELAARARRLGISTSRLRHLFRQEAGVSLRELRRWQRMRAVGEAVAAGASLTDAALSRGFSDSSQLSRDFRATFGIPPSRVFHAGARVQRHGDR